MKFKRTLSSVLCATIALSNVAYMPTFHSYADAVELNYAIEPFSNKHYNVVEYGERTLVSNKSYTESQARNQDLAKGVASAALAFGGPVGMATSFVYAVGNAIYDTSVAGKVLVYRTVETHYSVNRLTGQKTKTATYWKLEIKVYAGDSLHRELSHRFQLK